MLTKSRNFHFGLGLCLAVILCGCKPRKHNADTSTVSEASGVKKDPGKWSTPLNLVDITAKTQQPTKVSLIGEIERITLDNPSDVFSSGVIEVSGMRVVIPANLIIQMPVQRYTIQELFTQARAECIAKKQTGLALSDDCFYERRGGTATILANRTGSGAVVAGEVAIAKAAELVTGVVTYINYAEGYFRLNGSPNFPLSKTTGVMVRINDPAARHSIQSGLGCDNGINCTPDKRFPVDSDNYTAAFITGYPLCIPSTVAGSTRGTAVAYNVATNAVTGTDARCPSTNRPTNPATTDVPDSKYFAPIKIGDSLDATGNFERIGAGVNRTIFLSAHTIHVHVGLKTSPGKPDYMTFNETVWEVPGFPRQRARGGWLGFSTDPNSQFDLYRLAIDPNDPNEGTRLHEVPLGSTVGNPGTFNLGVPPNNQHIFRIHFKDDFLIGSNGRLSPCVHLANAGLSDGCLSGGNIDPAENFSVLSPPSREILAKSRNKKANPALVSFDVSGKGAPNGGYLSPVGIDHPEFLEVNLNRIQTPFLFTGEPWNLDRRLGPQGCGGDRGSCAAPAPLSPFPYDGGLNPMQQGLVNLPEAVGARMVMSYPYTNTSDGPVLPWETIDVDNTLPVNSSSPVILSQCVASP